MASFTYRPSDDIFASSAQVLVNPVNCVGIMGAGLAKEFKSRYPETFRSYQKVCSAGLLMPGKLQLVEEKGKMIMNFPTKLHWKDDSRIEFIDAGFVTLMKSYKRKGIKSIAFPKIGCGLGGLGWDLVRGRIEAHCRPLDLEVEIYGEPSLLEPAPDMDEVGLFGATSPLRYSR